jgi:hypothetical protein
VCNLSEIEAVFVHNEQRQKIWRGFIRYCDRLRPVNELDVLYVDGGFVTDNELPKDVDVIIEYPDMATFIRLATAHRYLRDRKFVKSAYWVDMLQWLPVLPPGADDMKEYFQLLRPEDALRRGLPAGSRKGILQLSLRS